MPYLAQFLSTPPSRVATSPVFADFGLRADFYPRHPRGWRLARLGLSYTVKGISIHATLAGGDVRQVAGTAGRHIISIHATLAGGDPLQQGHHHAEQISIHATLAGGDAQNDRQGACKADFYPRHPRGWRPCSPQRRQPWTPNFYPRHPRGWRLADHAAQYNRIIISIHATLAGGDCKLASTTTKRNNFYPRHPRGWRRFLQSLHGHVILFLSTPPSRVATHIG